MGKEGCGHATAGNNNVFGVCTKCADARDKAAAEKVAEINGEDLVGMYIKSGFVSALDARKEYMWSLVTSYDSGTNTLTGTLDNDPTIHTLYKCGQTVNIDKDKVVQVLHPKKVMLV